MLSLLNKRWAQLLRGPSPAWDTLTVDVDTELPAAAEPDEGAMVAWFQQRAGAVTRLHLRGSGEVRVRSYVIW